MNNSMLKKDTLSPERLPRYPTASVMGSLRFLDYLGTAVFAASGSILAASYNMDALGCIMIGFVTAVGGGTLRDCIWGRTPAFWIEESEYLAIAIFSALLGFLFCWLEQPAHVMVNALIFWGDTLGLGAFAVIGTMYATRLESNTLVVLFCAVLNSTGGGIIRDALVGVPIRVMHNHEEIYAETVAMGSLVYLVGRKCDVELSVRVLVSMFTVMGLRLWASHYGIRNIVAWL